MTRISYPPQLPVSQRKAEIAAAIRDHQVVVVAGETGSGKTTQLPKICLELGRGSDKRIGHTQPRRIAARSVAERIAEELGVELGSEVGYQVRFKDHSTRDTRIKLMTDGILLAELQHDRLLSAYDTIIIDEAHERSLNIDFLLGYLKQLLPKRPDLKVIITSATIDPGKFSRHFGGAPVIEVSGRTYPVEIRYRPLVEALDDEGEMLVRDQTEAIVDAVKELLYQGPGDILVFLPGEREIRDTADVLSAFTPARAADAFDVVPLFARLSAAEQHRVFEQHTKRRIVLATNVAETSLTVPGIRYVVDTGLARISRYSHRTKVQRLPIEAISQASAAQRSGRCGRVEAGIAVRLYSEEDFASRPEFTDPEILRTNLASVILQMTALGLGDIARFGFVDPPDRRQITAGVQLLEELGAISAPSKVKQAELDGPKNTRSRRTGCKQVGPRLTKLGRRIAAFPIDPRLARMVLEADRRGCIRDVVVITAALSIPDPRERPADKQTQADQKHARFTDNRSDFLTLLNLWAYLRTQQRELSSSAFRRMCRTDHLNYLRIREWQELEQQLRQVARAAGCRIPKQAGNASSAERGFDEDAIHQSLLAGLLSHIGLRDPDRRDYLGARGARFSVFPGSGLFKKPPQFIVASELVETSKLYARVNAAIQPEWAEKLGAALVKRSYSEPHWSKRRAAVLGYERVTLYGVPLVTDRLVNYGKVDPGLARELFIRHALVYGEWATRHRFFHRNRELLGEAEELEHRSRRRDLVVDEHTLFDFYDARIGAEVVSGAHFDSWWKSARRANPELLTFDPQMLLNEQAADIDEHSFPDVWHEGALTLPLSYHFDPGAADDGVTVDLPVTTLNQVSSEVFSWQVPGLREELVTALLRSLSKPLRVNFVPAPNFARDFLAAVPAGEEPLLDALERHLRAVTGVVVARNAWDLAKVPGHLLPTYRVVAEDGSVLDQGKDLAALKRPLAGSFTKAMQSAASEVTSTGQRSWTFGTIEQTFVRSRAGHEVIGYPGLVDEEDSVGLEVFGTEADRDAAHGLGVRRLLALAPQVKAARAAASGPIENLSNIDKLTLATAPYPSTTALLDDCVLAGLGALLAEPVYDQQAFEQILDVARTEVASRTGEVLGEVLRVLEAWREADRALSGSVDLRMLPARADLQAQVSRLVYRGFVADVGAGQLRRLPIYLRAAIRRRDKLTDLVRDQQLMEKVTPLQQAYLHRIQALPAGRPAPADLVAVRWMLEEYRVSLWAQELGTAYSISDARIRKALG